MTKESITVQLFFLSTLWKQGLFRAYFAIIFEQRQELWRFYLIELEQHHEDNTTHLLTICAVTRH
jgi:hypothetical protein